MRIESRKSKAPLSVAVLLGCAGWAMGQSSSLFLQEQAARPGAVATSQPALAGDPCPDSGSAVSTSTVVSGAASSASGSLLANAGATGSSSVPRNMSLAKTSLTALTLPEPEMIHVNDFISVIVRHRLRYETNSKLEQRNQWDLESKLAAWFRIHDDKWTDQSFRAGTPEIKFEHKNDLRNQGKFDRNDTLETRLMARIIDIKPNGTLVIFARKEISVDDEVQAIELTGECNKNDLGADRTITDDKIFDPRIKTINSGAVKDAAKRGWLKGFTDKVKPF